MEKVLCCIGLVFPLLIALLGEIMVARGKKKWLHLAWVEVIIFLASVTFIGTKIWWLDIASTMSIFTSLCGVFIIMWSEDNTEGDPIPLLSMMGAIAIGCLVIWIRSKIFG